MAGKTDKRRPEAKRGNFDKGHKGIRWASDVKRGKEKRCKSK